MNPARLLSLSALVLTCFLDEEAVFLAEAEGAFLVLVLVFAMRVDRHDEQVVPKPNKSNGPGACFRCFRFEVSVAPAARVPSRLLGEREKRPSSRLLELVFSMRPLIMLHKHDEVCELMRKSGRSGWKERRG